VYDWEQLKLDPEAFSGSYNLPEFEDPLSAEEKARMRFRRTWFTKGPFSNLGPRWGPSLHLYLKILPTDVYYKVRKALVVDLRIDKVNDSNTLYGIFREVSRIAKKHGDQVFPGFWKYLVNLELLGGFLPPAPDETFDESLEDWVTGDIIHSSWDGNSFDEEVFLKDFECGMFEFLAKAPSVTRANDRFVTPHEYAQDPANVGRVGATHYKHNVYFGDSTYVSRVGKTKWRTALVLGSEGILRLLSSDAPQSAKAVQKREAGKVRAVISADDSTFIRMDYVSKWLETALQGHPNTTLFMGTAQARDFWVGLSRACINNTVKLPLDQDKFDHQQNFRMITSFFKVLKRFIIMNASQDISDTLLPIVESVHRSLVVTPSFLTASSGKRFKITKGILSGWRWTALIDTVMNYGEMFAALRLLKRLGFGHILNSLNAQGDDDQINVDTYGQAAAIVQAYKTMNFGVNPGKFFVDTKRDEYLRQVITKGNVAGYPARGINAVMWRNPISRDPPAGILRLREQVKTWNTLIGRGCDERKCFNYMLVDCANANGLSKQQVLSILATPAVVGGVGMFRGGHTAITPGTIDHVGTVLTPLAGVNESIKRWSKLGMDIQPQLVREEVASVLDVTRAKRRVTPGVVREVEVPNPLMWTPKQQPSGMPLSAPVNPSLPKFLADSALRTAIREKNWSWIHDVYIDSSSASFSRGLFRRVRRRVWLAWVEGNLPWKIPTLVGQSELDASLVLKNLYSDSWGKAISRLGCNWTRVIRAALSAEFQLSELMQTREVRFGG
jgi:alkylhydroperoxidase/carboxymuconolactone decarboxylase family protein YurZ